MNSKVVIYCPRCGVRYEMKLESYKKRRDRHVAHLDNCKDCRPAQHNGAKIWENYAKANGLI